MAWFFLIAEIIVDVVLKQTFYCKLAIKAFMSVLSVITIRNTCLSMFVQISPYKEL